jgi:hypothetical protein
MPEDPFQLVLTASKFPVHVEPFRILFPRRALFAGIGAGSLITGKWCGIEDLQILTGMVS